MPAKIFALEADSTALIEIHGEAVTTVATIDVPDLEVHVGMKISEENCISLEVVLGGIREALVLRSADPCAAARHNAKLDPSHLAGWFHQT